MNSDRQSHFREHFRKLTDNQPFPWQEQLFDCFCENQIPRALDLPTGLGKTSVIPIWLIARCNQPNLPRRLVYVVNRRTVVDQTTAEVDSLRKRRCEVGGTLGEAIQELGLSTLRGQYADNSEWSADPSRPAVICGTVDMIGSRLLFGGYRIGFKAKPLHAGFLGQDVLLVHDEAHLEPAFQELVESIEVEQAKQEITRSEQESRNDDFGIPWPKFRVMSLSATTRKSEESQSEAKHTTDSNDKCHTIRLTPVDRKHEVVAKRINAKKQLALHQVATTDRNGKQLSDTNLRKAVVNEIERLTRAHADSNAAVLIFLRTVDAVKELSAKLPSDQTAQLTGTLRGLERDELVKTAIFQRFLPPSNREKNAEPAEGIVYLVCTSAGEVGVNISADHLVCDLSTFDSMAQRFGRVNRFGECEHTKIDVVHPKSFGKKDKNGKLQINEFERRRELTLKLLVELNETASPTALDNLDARQRFEAFAPAPTILPATDILFDAWAMTTIHQKMPGRPPLEPYLHGISGEWEPPQTYVAWREEVQMLSSEELWQRYPPASLLEDYPLKSCELARDTSKRVFAELKKLAKADGDSVIWVVETDGTVEQVTLASIVDTDETRIHHRTVLLPPKVGGLEKKGLLNGSAEYAEELHYDVSDQWVDENGESQRCRVIGDEPPSGMGLIRSLDLSTSEGDEESGRRWNWYVRPKVAENATRASTRPITWDHHTNDVVNRTKQIVQRLGIASQPLGSALIFAARVHDLGKRREQWQRSIGNPNPEEWYAKPGKPWRPRRLSAYRHEFGSLLDLLDQSLEFRAKFEREFDDDMQILILHVVAAHHGRARPHFPSDETYDTNPGNGEAAQTQAIEVPRRFAGLQRQYGRWGLAYIESILRAADWAASAEPSTAEVAQ